MATNIARVGELRKRHSVSAVRRQKVEENRRL
jgi:hypothetical protein